MARERIWGFSFVGSLLLAQIAHGQPSQAIQAICQGPWLYEQHQECEAVEHGVRYNSGPDPACGYIKDFSVRRASECGVESFKECRDKSNGVEQYVRVNKPGGGRRDAPNGDISKCGAAISNDAKWSLDYWKHTHPADTDAIESHTFKGGHEKDSLGKVTYHCWFDIGIFKPIYQSMRSQACGVETYLECPPKNAHLTCELEKFGQAGFKLARSANCPYEKTLVFTSGNPPSSLPPLEKAYCSTCDEMPVRNLAEWRKRLSCLAERNEIAARAREKGSLASSTAMNSNSVAVLDAPESAILQAMEGLITFGLSKDRAHAVPLLLEFGEELQRSSLGSGLRLWNEAVPSEVIGELQQKSFSEIEKLDSKTFLALFKTQRNHFFPSPAQRVQLLNKLATLSLEDNVRFRLVEMWLSAELGDIVELVDQQLQLRLQIYTLRRSKSPSEIEQSIRTLGRLTSSIPSEALANFTAKSASERAEALSLLNSIASKMDETIQARLQDSGRVVESEPFGNEAFRAALQMRLSIVKLSSTGFNRGLSQANGALSRLPIKGELIRSCEESVRLAAATAKSLDLTFQILTKVRNNNSNGTQLFAEARTALMTIEDLQTRLAVAQAISNIMQAASENDQNLQDALENALVSYFDLLKSFSAEASAAAQLLNLGSNEWRN